MKHQPPRLAQSILRRFCHVSFLEEVAGDLDEQFYERVETKGLFSARMHYWLDVMRAIASGNAHGRTGPDSRASLADSLAHFFKIFFRNLRHNQSSSFINIAGLALSLMSFVVIYLYVVDELTYDSFHPDAENIYRISHTYPRYGDGVYETDARAGGEWVGALRERMPEAIASTRFSRFGYPGFVKYEQGDKIFEEAQFFWVDANYADIFSLRMITGEPSVILKDPHNVIINQSTADRYFGNEAPIGKEIIYSRNGMDFTLVVAGVMRDYPTNAHFHPDFLANNAALQPMWKRDGGDRVNSWVDAFTYSFFRLEPGTDPAKAVKILDGILHDHLPGEVKATRAVLTRLTDIHFTHGKLIELEAPGDAMYAYIAGSVGVLILIIAAINYMNLATARSVRRSKEVGLRKTLGVRRTSLISQFIGESVVLVTISFVISLGLTIAMLPFFNQVTGKAFDIFSLWNGNILTILFGVILVLALLSGSYPAFYLSNFKPADVLKGKVITGGGAESFRRMLVVFQFSVTIVLITGAAVVHNQLEFIQSGKLAAHGEQIISVRLNDSEQHQREAFLQDKNVADVSFSDHLPRRSNMGFMTLPFVFPSLTRDEHMWDGFHADENFASMFDLEFVGGRNFSHSSPADTTNVILNEAAVNAMHLTTDQALGLSVSVNIDFAGPDHHIEGHVIGVVKDFPYASVRNVITPMVLIGRYKNSETMNIRLSGNNYQEAITNLEKKWRQLFPSAPFKYWFMDEEFAKLYEQEQRMGKLSDYFTLFAIVIACLGLFGLASFTAEQKTKEIGIRKVMGASVRQILFLLTNRFVRLVLISFVISIPLAIYAMNSWLENFAYKVPMHWSVFVGAGGLILALTYLTVGIESIRAAIANPVNSIRHE
jgi:putative ABC transport system permease protein